MSTKVVDIKEAQKDLPGLLSHLREAEDIVLEDAGAPVARIVPIASAGATRVAGLHKGAIQTSPDFDEPLSEELWVGKE